MPLAGSAFLHTMPATHFLILQCDQQHMRVAQGLVRDVAELLREAVADIDEPRAVSALAAAPGPPAQGLHSASALSEVRSRACSLAWMRFPARRAPLRACPVMRFSMAPLCHSCHAECMKVVYMREQGDRTPS